IHYLALRPVLKRIEEENLKARLRAKHAQDKLSFGDPHCSDLEQRYKRFDQHLKEDMSCDSMFDASETAEGVDSPIYGRLRIPKKTNDESDDSVDIVQWFN
ncbi:unnamed protein product, partial [Lymnaea stagnalis]